MDDLVFHYCSIETFFAIITNKTLRLSDVVKSNDNLEVLWVKKVLLEMIENETMSYEHFSEEIQEIISMKFYKLKLREKIEIFLNKKEVKSKFFAICFSGAESEDKLSQWRGYGDDGRGIAIGFRKHVLEKTRKKLTMYNDEVKVEFRKVEYKIEKQKEVLRKFWKEKIQIANITLKNIEIDFEVWMLNCFEDLYQKSIFMKNPFFEEENESRIVLRKTGDIESVEEELANKMQIKNGELIIKNGNILEYFDLDIAKLLDGFIEKIILGPKCNAEKEDIEMLMKRNGYKNFQVIWSKGSYR